MCHCAVGLVYHREPDIVELSLDDIRREGGKRGSVAVDPFPRVVHSCSQVLASLRAYLVGMPMSWLLRFGGLSVLSAVQNVSPSSAESGLRSVCGNRQVPPTQFSLYMDGVSTTFEKVHGGQSFFLVSPGIYDDWPGKFWFFFCFRCRCPFAWSS